MQKGRFKLTVVGRTEGKLSEGGDIMVVGRVSGNQDPGYGETSKVDYTCICLYWKCACDHCKMHIHN